MKKFMTFHEWIKKMAGGGAGGPYDLKMTNKELQKGGAGGVWGAPQSVVKGCSKCRK